MNLKNPNAGIDPSRSSHPQRPIMFSRFGSARDRLRAISRKHDADGVVVDLQQLDRGLAERQQQRHHDDQREDRENQDEDRYALLERRTCLTSLASADIDLLLVGRHPTQGDPWAGSERAPLLHVPPPNRSQAWSSHFEGTSALSRRRPPPDGDGQARSSLAKVAAKIRPRWQRLVRWRMSRGSSAPTIVGRLTRRRQERSCRRSRRRHRWPAAPLRREHRRPSTQARTLCPADTEGRRHAGPCDRSRRPCGWRLPAAEGPTTST